ncbi:phosphoglycerate mutase-like protein [Pholiota conissans]|uniref:Phosphoglycerate mutase-like protein n=1 Tax=Pholiota conissans TaxID=109636 RepID=A0A9P5ZB48_9AGAR|nr:phosphoglycerate mutase-like protein [Pholiota conissans]
MVHFLLIRHGESKDNLSGVWAGWKDAPLSNHGMNQAEALAESLSSIKLSTIYSSDLLRAKTTAAALKKKQLHADVPHHELSALREQHFGIGEGMKFSRMEPGLSLEDHYARGKYPAIFDRQQSFPGGESLDDVAKRAESVIEAVLLPHLLQEKEEKEKQVLRTVAIVSHGLFIGELMSSIIQRDPATKSTHNSHDFRGTRNTAWMRVEITLQNESGQSDPLSDIIAHWRVKVSAINEHSHLSKVHRQKGGIGSLAHDAAQKDIRTFFGKRSSESQSKSVKSARAKPY